MISSAAIPVGGVHRSEQVTLMERRLLRAAPALCGASLYAQWAAAPYSAVLCMEDVRIWTSIGMPAGPAHGTDKRLLQQAEHTAALALCSVPAFSQALHAHCLECARL